MWHRWRVIGGTAALVALAVVAAEPAMAAAPSSVAAGTPSWLSSQLKAIGSFKNTVSASATYSYTMQLVRTSTASRPTCTTASGCLSSGTSQVLLNQVTSSVTVPKSATVKLPVLSVNCSASSTTRYYWSWLKVADSSGNVVVALSSYRAGKYC